MLLMGILALVLCSSQKKPSSAILFDLNGVLFRLSRGKTAQHLGIMTSIAYTAGGNSFAELEEKLFRVLDSIDPEQCDHTELMPRHNGKSLPKIMRDWLAGCINSQNAIERMEQKINELASLGFFKSKREVKLLKRLAHIVFNPTLRARIYKPIKDGIELVRECKEHGHQVYLISNMDSELVSLLREKHPDIFELFDGTIISGDISALKPHPEIYLYTLINHNLNPETCVLIDDQIENIEGAEHIGMQGILCNHKEYHLVMNALIEKNLITSKKNSKIKKI